mmetsp:Transcript_40294/g.85038  ORF Transcript_40294/g.85038 Transcript_40294/m.85038 type:complete len:104 (-) Transcript_40294:313-624(-)
MSCLCCVWARQLGLVWSARWAGWRCGQRWLLHRRRIGPEIGASHACYVVLIVPLCLAQCVVIAVCCVSVFDGERCCVAESECLNTGRSLILTGVQRSVVGVAS